MPSIRTSISSPIRLCGNRQDVLAIQEILDAHNSKIKIIAKIENQEGVDNIDEILEVAYGVMVARGDLGIEVPQEKIPGIQRRLIKKCVQAKKPVIVATQMLHSMIKNPRPTRAEVTDVANAIYYRTDALMLSGETAYGKYPVEAIATMSRIAKEAELTKLSDNDIQVNVEGEVIDTTFVPGQARRRVGQGSGGKGPSLPTAIPAARLVTWLLTGEKTLFWPSVTASARCVNWPFPTVSLPSTSTRCRPRGSISSKGSLR